MGTLQSVNQTISDPGPIPAIQVLNSTSTDFPPDGITDAQAPAPISSRQLAVDLEQMLLVAAARPCFIGLSLSTHASTTSAAGDVDRHRMAVHVSTNVAPSRILQAMVNVLLRADPSRARTDREKQQVDEVYKPGLSFRFTISLREQIPNGEVARPCPHCLPGNRYGCESLLAIDAPTTTKCDMCQVFFCGIGMQHRCVAVHLANVHPHGMSNIGDLIQSTEVYECFDSNAVEVEIILDYLGTQNISPRQIYCETSLLVSIVQHILSQPRKFALLIELDLFVDIHSVPPGPEPGLDAPRQRICRMCAAEVLLYGLKDWWIRERKKGFLDVTVLERPNCLDGTEEVRSCFLAPFGSSIQNTPGSLMNGRITTKGRIKFHFKTFGALTVVFVEVKLKIGSVEERMNAIAQVIAECDACDWNNMRFDVSIPIYGILCDGSSFQFFTFDASTKPYKFSTQEVVSVSLRLICETVFNLLLVAYIASLKVFHDRSTSRHGQGKSLDGWDKVLKFAEEALEESQDAEALR
ncbi:hypothetical protein BJV78DRAFT_1155718 [Lactifluus subvellereus]|nr:hypothetical protein BJV78DRAFT_1155718 [Lactifluus subvellereus]